MSVNTTVANRDYVRKKPTPKKNTNRKTNNRKTQSKASGGFPWKATIIALVLLAGFIAVINILNNDPEPVKSSVQPVNVPETKPQKHESLPPPPREKWDYMHTLPKREIEVQAKAIQIPDIPYIMQCGAYKSHPQAEQRKANIAFQGLSSKIVKLKGSEWYRIILGPYTFKRDAVKEQHALQRARIEPCIIMKDALK